MSRTSPLARIQNAWPAIFPIHAWQKSHAVPASLTGSTLTLHVSDADLVRRVASAQGRISERASIVARRPITAVVCELSPHLPAQERRAEASRLRLPVSGSNLRMVEASLAEACAKLKGSDHPAAVLLRAAAVLAAAASRSVEDERRGADEGAYNRAQELAGRLSELLPAK
jgi:hypothetical protein